MTIFKHSELTDSQRQRNDRIALVCLGALIGIAFTFAMLALNSYICTQGSRNNGKILMVTPRNIELSNPYVAFMPVNVTPEQAAHNEQVQRELCSKH